MSVLTLEAERHLNGRRLERPQVGKTVHIPYDGVERFDLNEFDPPSELRLEATGPDGQTALWLDDLFWLELIQCWSWSPITIRLLPTPGSLLHPVLLHQLSMLRRVAPCWRLVGQCYAGDLDTQETKRRAALAVYHEIELLDAPRPGGGSDAPAADVGSVMDELATIQASHGREEPAFRTLAGLRGDAAVRAESSTFHYG